MRYTSTLTYAVVQQFFKAKIFDDIPNVVETTLVIKEGQNFWGALTTRFGGPAPVGSLRSS